MYKNKRFLAIIPARSGSKGLPNKNIKNLLGKPLIAYSIETALATGEIDDVIVSTDSMLYAEIAKRYGAEVPFLRPAELASDTSLATDYIVHALQTLKENGRTYDYFVLLQPTSPLRTVEHILSGIKMAVDEELSGVVSFSKADHPMESFHRLPVDLNLGRVAVASANRQDFIPYYRINGMLYISDCEVYLNTRTCYGPNSKALIIENRYAIDIDTELDFEIAEFLMNRSLSNDT